MMEKGHMIDNRYRIIKPIGEGGMANVYLALDTILEREVAVKILRGDLAEDEKFVRRFQREANAASSLRHPNIVEMYDVGKDNGQYFIVMEYISGKTLKSLIKKRGALTLPEVIDIMLQLTNGIACAHDSYIIHRDIKPQNVLILEDGRVKITDFGIAMAVNNTELTQTNSVMGSVHYLPPEQAAGSGATIKSDIYSLGILMYELITGKLPFKGDNAVEIALKQLKEAIPSICEQNSSIPQSVENIILKACAKNPKNRYNSVSEMYEDIKTALEPSRFDEPRMVYKYSEHDLDETKIMPNLKQQSKKETREQRNQDKEEIIEEQKEWEEEFKEDKKLNIAIIIIGSICAVAVVIGMLFLFGVFGKKSTTYTIPAGLVGKTQEYVEEKFDSIGIAYEIIEEVSDEVEEGDVIKISPKEKSTIQKGKVVKIYVSVGEGTIEIENYEGMNVEVVEKQLIELGLQVVKTPRKIDKTNDQYQENAVMEQSIKAGEKAKKNSVIELFYATLITVYPDFTDGTYTKTDINHFCEDNKINCKFVEQETKDYLDGTIIKQSRAAGVEVKEGASLEITIAIPVKEEQKPEVPEEETETETDKPTEENTTQDQESN